MNFLCNLALEKHVKNDKEQELKRAAAGCLMELKKDTGKLIMKISAKGTKKPTEKGRHVMISYNHMSRETAVKVRDGIRKLGMKTWFDEDDIGGGSLVDAMAAGVEGSGAVVICYSEEYFNSPNCRQEAQFAFKLQKSIIPVRVQEKYSPGGWLGFILGSELYFDLSTELKLSANFPKLMQQISSKVPALQTEQVDSKEKSKAATVSAAKPQQKQENVLDGHAARLNALPPIRSTSAIKISTSCTDWKVDTVLKWLKENELSAFETTYFNFSFFSCPLRIHYL